MKSHAQVPHASTPDHTHFHPAWWAIARGKHVYLGKPPAREVEEVRRITEAARAKKLATQLGSQRHPLCNFEYTGPLANRVLLANIAYRVQGELAWDTAAMKSDRDDVNGMPTREYLKGWRG
jgi:hypothetical protein